MSNRSRSESSYRMKIANKSKRKRKRSQQQRPKKINMTNPRIRKESIKNLTSTRVGKKNSLTTSKILISNKTKNLTKVDKNKDKKKKKKEESYFY